MDDSQWCVIHYFLLKEMRILFVFSELLASCAQLRAVEMVITFNVMLLVVLDFLFSYLCP